MISNTDAIGAIVEEIFDAGRCDADFSKMYYKGECLRSYGPEIVDVILDELAQRKLLGNIQYNDRDAVYQLVRCLYEYAEDRHAAKIASLFYWDEIASDGSDRSTRCCLLNMLKKIGGATEIQVLEEFTELVKNAEYGTEDFEGISFVWDGHKYDIDQYRERESGREKALRLRRTDQHDIRKTIDAIKSRVS